MDSAIIILFAFISGGAIVFAATNLFMFIRDLQRTIAEQQQFIDELVKEVTAMEMDRGNGPGRRGPHIVGNNLDDALALVSRIQMEREINDLKIRQLHEVMAKMRGLYEDRGDA